MRWFMAVQYGRVDSAGVPRLRIALPDTRCPRIELRAAGGALLPKRILRCRLEVDPKDSAIRPSVEARLPASTLIFWKEESWR